MPPKKWEMRKTKKRVSENSEGVLFLRIIDSKNIEKLSENKNYQRKMYILFKWRVISYLQFWLCRPRYDFFKDEFYILTENNFNIEYMYFRSLSN